MMTLPGLRERQEWWIEVLARPPGIFAILEYPSFQADPLWLGRQFRGQLARFGTHRGKGVAAGIGVDSRRRVMPLSA